MLVARLPGHESEIGPLHDQSGEVGTTGPSHASLSRCSPRQGQRRERVLGIAQSCAAAMSLWGEGSAHLVSIAFAWDPSRLARGRDDAAACSLSSPFSMHILSESKDLLV